MIWQKRVQVNMDFGCYIGTGNIVYNNLNIDPNRLLKLEKTRNTRGVQLEIEDFVGSGAFAFRTRFFDRSLELLDDYPKSDMDLARIEYNDGYSVILRWNATISDDCHRYILHVIQHDDWDAPLLKLRIKEIPYVPQALKICAAFVASQIQSSKQ